MLGCSCALTSGRLLRDALRLRRRKGTVEIQVHAGRWGPGGGVPGSAEDLVRRHRSKRCLGRRILDWLLLLCRGCEAVVRSS